MLLEPTYGVVEAGCQGTMRAMVTTTGRRAHSARSWRGVNAIHAAGEVLRRLAAYEARRVEIDGCEYREGLNAVRINGGVAGNVIPDRCEVEVNYRFAPDRSARRREAHLREVFAGYEVAITDSAPGALPGLTAAPAQEFLAAVGHRRRSASSAGPTCPGSRRSASRRSTSARATPTWPTPSTSTWRSPKIRAGAETLRRWLAA